MSEPNEEMLAAQAELERATARAAEIAQQQASMDLERVSSTRDAQQIRSDMEQVQLRVERAVKDVERASARVKREMDRQVKQMQADLAARTNAVNAALEPIRKRLELMQEGIDTLGLYMSAARGVVMIRDGSRAPEEEPIVIRQMVLAMDEETGLFADQDGMNATDVESFDDWLLASADHVQQIIPEPKSVVALVARWRERVSGDPWSHDEADKVTHFLVRNGDALFRTSVNDFIAGRVLLPRADEFTSFFFADRGLGRDRRKAALQPGSADYAKAMEASDKRGRHFLRIGLILQGLVDNSDVFKPLHPAGVNMLTDPSQRSEKVRIITDAEGGLQSGQATFREWQANLNAQLRPGMRVIGAFNASAWQDANDWNTPDHPRRWHGHSRCWPLKDAYEPPPSGVPLVIEERRSDGGLILRYTRTKEIFDTTINEPVPGKPGHVYRGKHRLPKTRARVIVYPADTFILPFDLVESAAQLRGFLASRRNREDYRDLWPMIRAGLFAKQAEEAAEAPLRQMLVGVLARENNVTVAQAEGDVDELIRWFKLKNRMARPLTIAAAAGSLEHDDAAKDAVDEDEVSASGRPTMAAVQARHARQLAEAEAHGDVEFDEAAYERALEEAAAAELQGRERDALAVRAIVAEHARRLADRRRPINAQVVARLRAEYPDALLIARPRSGGYLMLLAAHPTDNVWVHELEFSARGVLRDRRDWRLVGGHARLSRWTVCYRHDRFDAWDIEASEHFSLRDPEIDMLCQRLVGSQRQLGAQPMMVSYQPARPDSDGRFTAWVMLGERTVERGPEYVARDFFWQRKGGELTLHKPEDRYDAEHKWELGGSDQAPWLVSSWATRHVGRVVWGPDADLVARWTKLRSDHLALVNHREALRTRARDLAGSVAAQWKAQQTVALYEQFLADVPDARWEEWVDHLKANQPTWIWDDSHHRPYGELEHLLRFVVEHDIDPTGMTAQQALDRARELGLPEAWEGFGSSVNPYPERFPAGWADLVIGAQPVAIPQPPAPPDTPPEPSVGVRIADGVEVLDPDDPASQRDDFDDLRDTLRDLGL